MSVLAIDPGTDQSAFVLYEDGVLHDMGIVPNDTLRRKVFLNEFDVNPDRLAIEMFASYGMPVGKEVFETCVWIGRFIEAWKCGWDFVYRKDIKLHLCHSSRAKDANVRQALLDRFPRTGGGKVPQIGTKSQPGPLYGVKSHIWSALAVAVYFEDVYCEVAE